MVGKLANTGRQPYLTEQGRENAAVTPLPKARPKIDILRLPRAAKSMKNI